MIRFKIEHCELCGKLGHPYICICVRLNLFFAEKPVEVPLYAKIRSK